MNKQTYGERIMGLLLDAILSDVCGPHFNNARPEWLVNPKSGRRLELDRYYPQTGLAFEYHGPGHYRDHNTDHSARDALKRDLCYANGVKLVILKKGHLGIIALSRSKRFRWAVPKRLRHPGYKKSLKALEREVEAFHIQQLIDYGPGYSWRDEKARAKKALEEAHKRKGL